MKEVVLIGAYTDNIEKEVTLIKTILDWKKHSIPVVLCSHYPVSERIQNLVDYYVFDREQYLDQRLINLHTYTCKDFKISAKYDRPYHAAAALISYQNAIRLIGNKYEFIYFHDYDVALNKEEVLKTIRPLQTSSYEMFMFNWNKNPDTYATNCLFFKQGAFNKIWGDIRSVDDYLNLVILTKKPNNLIEILAKNIVDVKNLQHLIYLFDDEKRSQLISNFTEYMADIIEPRIYLSRTSTGQAILFLVNPLQDMLTFKMQMMNLTSGEQQEIIQKVSGKIGMYWRIFNNGIRLQVSCNNTKKEYYLIECNNFNECWFEFTNGTQIFMK